MIFDVEKVQEIHERAIAYGLHEKRNFLLFGIREGYVAQLRQIGNPGEQLLSDLQFMSNDGALGDAVSLERWLRNAAYLSRNWEERRAFFSQCAEEARTAVKNGVPVQPPAPQGPSPVLVPGGGPMPTAGLDAARKEALVKALADCLALEDFQLALQRCFGDSPIRAGEPDKMPAIRDIAMQSIELAEREKLTVVLLAFLLGSERCNENLKQVAFGAFPELELVGQSFSAIVDMVLNGLQQNAAILAPLFNSAVPVQALARSVAELKCYKRLHEAIHQVKNQQRPPVPAGNDSGEKKKFLQGLRQYFALVTTAHVKSDDALAELPAGSRVKAAEGPLIILLAGCAARIEGALNKADIAAAEVALEVAARTIDPMLDEFNQQIVEAAKQLLDGPLGTLRTSMAVHPTEAAALGPAINAMDALRLALRIRTLEHTRWQEADTLMFLLDEALQSQDAVAFKKFARKWSVMRKQISTLTDSDRRTDMVRLHHLALNVDTVLVDIEKSVETNAVSFDLVMLEPYEEFRFEAQQQFLMIDAAFKRNCTELSRIS